MRTVLAIDIGGTKMAAGIVDDSGAILRRAQAPTPGDGPAEELFGVLRALVDEVRTGEEDGCGVGCGGPMDMERLPGLSGVPGPSGRLSGVPGPSGRLSGVTVSPLNIPAWRTFPLYDRLRDYVELEVTIDNDAKALALAEGWVGAAAGERSFLAMVVSTGVGGGIVLDGRLLEGAAGNAGHIGHVIVEPGGSPCACGARGCLEAEASGTGILARTGRPPREASAEVVERTGTMVGRGVASACNLLDLRVVLVAGSVALGFGAPFFAAAQRELDACARLEFSAGARIRPGALGADGPLVGAAAVAWRALGVAGIPA